MNATGQHGSSTFHGTHTGQSLPRPRLDDLSGVRILVVDDEPLMREELAQCLAAESAIALSAPDGPTALETIANERVDLVVLDLGLPGLGGLQVLHRVRATSEIPVIIVSGRSDEVDRIVGLDLGADDYLGKPVSSGELIARIRSVLRRSGSFDAPRMLEFEGLTIDLGSREVRVAGRPVHLTAREFDLLAFLARSPRRVFSREDLLEQVWGSSASWQDVSTVSEHVHRLRRKIESDPGSPTWIITLRGVGYRFEPHERSVG